MQTIFVTGSDTGVGKTRVAAAIGRLLAKPDLRIQFIKPIETGSTSENSGDAVEAARMSELASSKTFTLFRFNKPLAPLAAAEFDHRPLSLTALLDEWKKLPPADLRIVEGAGGIAVPLDCDGRDWSDFAREIGAHQTVLVIADRLGAINQARLTFAYAARKNLFARIWLNEIEPQPDEILESNRGSLCNFLWASQRFGETLPENPTETLRRFSV